MRGGGFLTLSLSVVAALGVLVILLCRYAGLRIWHALACITLGFYLASSSLAAEISHTAACSCPACAASGQGSVAGRQAGIARIVRGGR